MVLHLGCGMDTRAFRLHPPETVQWFDLDQPNVTALRRKLYDDCAGYRMIRSSVTDEAWLDEMGAVWRRPGQCVLCGVGGRRAGAAG